MSKKPLTCTFVMTSDGVDGASDIVVIGCGRSSRRQTRVRAKLIAQSEGFERPLIGTHHTTGPVQVAPCMYVETMP
jgi:hypothetical protein